LVAAPAMIAAAVAHVPGDAHMRVQRVGLEHHRDVSIFRGEIVDALSSDADLAFGDVFQPGDHPQQRRLAAA